MHQSNDIVYGERGQSLFALPRNQAEDLVQVWKAIYRAETWGDFKTMMPADEYESLMYRMEDYYEEDELPFPPPDTLPFKEDLVTVFVDGDWPTSPFEYMLEWMPIDIQQAFGSREGETVMSGPQLNIDYSKTPEIIARLTSSGYTCTHDQDLINGVWGDV